MTSLIEAVREQMYLACDYSTPSEPAMNGMAFAAIQVVLRKMMTYRDTILAADDDYVLQWKRAIQAFAYHHNIDLTEPKP